MRCGALTRLAASTLTPWEWANVDEIEKLCDELTQLKAKLPATMSEAVLLLIEVERLREQIQILNNSGNKTS